MQFSSLHDFLHMGGYAFFVWLAYGVTFLCLLILLVTSLQQKNKILTHIAKKMAREERLKQNRRNNESKT